jgi:hypothetical protein
MVESEKYMGGYHPISDLKIGNGMSISEREKTATLADNCVLWLGKRAARQRKTDALRAGFEEFRHIARVNSGAIECVADSRPDRCQE